MFQRGNCSGLQTLGVILSRGGGGRGQALGLCNKVLLSLLPPTSFTCKSVCAHKSQLSGAVTFPSRELQFQPQQQEAQSRRPWRRQEHPGRVAGCPQEPEGKPRWVRSLLLMRELVRAFLLSLAFSFFFIHSYYFKSVASVDGSQSEKATGPLRRVLRCTELGGMLSRELGCGRAGVRASPVALVALLPLPRTGAASRGAWAPLLRRLVRPRRLGFCGGWQGTVRRIESCRGPLLWAGGGGQ